MSAPIRVGLVGTSWWAEGMFLPALTSHPGAQVAALCGRGRPRAEELAGRFGVPAVFTDYGEMIDRGGLDALVVATPDDLHHPMTLRALGAGLHVLCDKPLASDGAQALEMWRAARAAGVVHLVLFTFRWLPAFRHLEKLVAEGYVGRVHHAEFHYLSGSGRTDAYGWRFDRRRANGVLGDVGSHLIDLAHALVGPITRVSARLAVEYPRQAPPGGVIEPANDVALLQVDFAGGAVGLLQTSCVAHLGDRGMQQRVALYGQVGSLELEVAYSGAEGGARLRGARGPNGRFQAIDIPDGALGALPHSDPASVFCTQSAGPRLFIDAIRSGAPATPDFGAGYRAQCVIDAALRADAEGRGVAVETAAGL